MDFIPGNPSNIVAFFRAKLRLASCFFAWLRQARRVGSRDFLFGRRYQIFKLKAKFILTRGEEARGSEGSLLPKKRRWGWKIANFPSFGAVLWEIALWHSRRLLMRVKVDACVRRILGHVENEGPKASGRALGVIIFLRYNDPWLYVRFGGRHERNLNPRRVDYHTNRRGDKSRPRFDLSWDWLLERKQVRRSLFFAIIC